MELLLLFILIAAEILFLIFEAVKKSSDKKTWTIRRLIVNAGEIVLYCIMLLLPGIDTGFRFTGLIIMLVLRIVVSGIFWLINRKSSKTKKKSAIVLGGLFGALLIIASLVVASYPTGESRAEETKSTATDFRLNGTTLVKYTGTATTVSVPDTCISEKFTSSNENSGPYTLSAS